MKKIKRKTLINLHVAATFIAALTIISFFSLSVFSEIKGDIAFIKQVKYFIICVLPVMIIAMLLLRFTGNTLAGKSQNSIILKKKKRMKWMQINGVVLILLAIFLYYRSHYCAIDYIFLTAQIIEFICGLTNLTLIGYNIKSGLELSGKIKKNK